MRAPSRRSRRIGRGGEWLALAWLLLKGYRLRDRNWRGGGAELDLVMEHRGELVFVEVKTRSADVFGGAVGAVREDKRRAVERAAAAYLTRHGAWDRRARFDVVAIDRSAGPPWWRVRHYRNAFPATGAPAA
jgi:putative endonuclease